MEVLIGKTLINDDKWSHPMFGYRKVFVEGKWGWKAVALSLGKTRVRGRRMCCPRIGSCGKRSRLRKILTARMSRTAESCVFLNTSLGRLILGMTIDDYWLFLGFGSFDVFFFLYGIGNTVILVYFYVLWVDDHGLWTGKTWLLMHKLVVCVWWFVMGWRRIVDDNGILWFLIREEDGFLRDDYWWCLLMIIGHCWLWMVAGDYSWGKSSGTRRLTWIGLRNCSRGDMVTSPLI